MRKKAWARPELAVCPFFYSVSGGNPRAVGGTISGESAGLFRTGLRKCPFLAEMGLRHPEINFIGD